MLGRPSPNEIRARIEALVLRAYGAVDENLLSSGIVDSIKAVELLLQLETEFDVRLVDVPITDLATVTNIVALIDGALGASR